MRNLFLFTCSFVLGLCFFLSVPAQATASQADVDAINEAFRGAAFNGNVGQVKKLLAQGASVHNRDDWALRWASIHGDKQMVEALLSANADPHAACDEPIRMAAENHHQEVLRTLIEAAEQNPGTCPPDDVRHLTHSQAAFDAIKEIYTHTGANIPASAIK
jgi:ankyrin repeat protein